MSTLTAERSPLLGAWHARRSTDLQSHLAHHGPLQLPTRLDDRWPDRFTALLTDSGLTGRGGASFPSAIKLRQLRSLAQRATLVVNAMEGEPASMKDGVLLSYAPHLVIEGAQLVALAVGASRVVICIPADRENCARAVLIALSEREGNNLSPVPVEVARPPGRYVAGEESALASWLDGKAGVPTFRRDKAIPLSVGRSSALVHNAETLAHVALIARHGAGWFRTRGGDNAPGSTLVTLSGTVEHPGVYEVPLGTSIGAVVHLAMPSRDPAAVLVGGYGGTWLGAADLEVPFSPAALREKGASVGPGVLVVVDDSVCGIAETALIARYMAAESAGQCGPCVFGLPAVAEDLARLADGVAEPGTLARLLRRLDQVEGRGACRHPDGAVRMARSALSVFAGDLSAHLAGRPCSRSKRKSVLLFPAGCPLR